MKKTLLLSSLFFFSLQAQSLEGTAHLEKLLIEKSPALAATENEIKSKENILKSAHASYYPSLNAVGGWGENRVDNPIDTDKGYTGYLEGRFNLFNGFRDSSVTNQKDLDLQMAKLEHEQLQRNLKLKLIEAVGEMIYLHGLQEILATEEQITKEQKQMAARKVSSGLTSSVDNLEFDLREEEIRIQQRQINQQHLEAHQKLLQLFGTDIADRDLHDLHFSELVSLRAVKQYKAEDNVEVQKSQIQFELSKLEHKIIQGDFLPSLDFIYSYGRLTPSEETRNFNETNYRMQISIPLFSGFSTVHKENAALLESKSRKSTLQQSAMDSLSLYNSLAEKMKELSDLYTINERKLKTSEKYFNLTVSEYKRGVKNSPDLVGATERWFSAQKRKPELLKELELTKAHLENITGF